MQSLRTRSIAMLVSAVVQALTALVASPSAAAPAVDASLGARSIDRSPTNGHRYRLEELCEIALEMSPQIRVQEFRVDARRSDIVLRRNDLLPVINLNVNSTNSQDTDLVKSGARINWNTSWSELRLRDLELARLGLLSAEEYLRRQQVWVLNDVATVFRDIAVMEMRSRSYELVIDVTGQLSSDAPGFAFERDLKVDEYQTELTRISDRIVDLTSRLSALAFGDPYGVDLEIDPAGVRYVEIPVDRKAAVRRAIQERLRPNVLDLSRAGIRVKLATRAYQPSFRVGVERWRVDGTAGQGYTDDDTTITASINLVINPFASRAARNRAIAELNVLEAEATVDLNDLVNSTKRALDRLSQARDNLLGHYEKYGEEPVDFAPALWVILGDDPDRVDRQVFTTLDLLLKNDLKRIEYLSDYVQALIALNNHVMVTPLTLHLYRNLDPGNTLPEVFDFLPLSAVAYERHVEELLSR